MNYDSDSHATIISSVYKGLASIVLENDRLRVEVVPSLGAKLVSLFYKPSGKEWLLSSTDTTLEATEYGSDFTKAALCGWDECFPTINPSGTAYQADVHLPDHGEVWALPWQSETDVHGLSCSVKGVQLPYLLTRRLELGPGSELNLHYNVLNTGVSAFSFLWAMHPLFAVTEETAILLPSKMEKMVCVYGGQSLEEGVEYQSSLFNKLSPLEKGDGLKFYYSEPVGGNWSGLYGEETGNYITVSASGTEVPQFGVWIDSGFLGNHVAVALEPGIGYYDSLARAESNGSALKLEPGEAFSWSICLSLGQGISRCQTQTISS